MKILLLCPIFAVLHLYLTFHNCFFLECGNTCVVNEMNIMFNVVVIVVGLLVALLDTRPSIDFVFGILIVFCALVWSYVPFRLTAKA